MKPIKTYKELVLTFVIPQLLFFAIDLALLFFWRNSIRAASVLLVGAIAFVLGYPFEYKKLINKNIIVPNTLRFLLGYIPCVLLGVGVISISIYMWVRLLQPVF